MAFPHLFQPLFTFSGSLSPEEVIETLYTNSQVMTPHDHLIMKVFFVPI